VFAKKSKDYDIKGDPAVTAAVADLRIKLNSQEFSFQGKTYRGRRQHKGWQAVIGKVMDFRGRKK